MSNLVYMTRFLIKFHQPRGRRGSDRVILDLLLPM